MKKRFFSLALSAVLGLSLVNLATAFDCAVEDAIAHGSPFEAADFSAPVSDEQLVRLVESGVLCPEVTWRITMTGGSLSDISPLALLPNLTHVTLWNNNISDLTPLSGLTNLRTLDIGGNQIVDVSPLTGLLRLGQGIAHLDLTDNPVEDVMPLATLVHLDSTTLVLHGTPAESDSVQLAELAEARELYRAATGRRILTLGHIFGHYEFQIGDALEILRFSVGLPSLVNECDIARLAALIVSEDEPGVADALEILRHLVGLESALN